MPYTAPVTGLITVAGTYTASEQANISKLTQLNDTTTTSDQNWLMLHQNAVDGTYHPVGPTSEIGWMGTTVSDTSGAFASYPTLFLTFSLINAIHQIYVAGDAYSNSWPVDFAVDVYRTGVVVYSVNVTGSNSPIWRHDIDHLVEGDQIVLTVRKINKANSVVYITEFQNQFNFSRSDSILLKSSEHSIAGEALQNITTGDSLLLSTTEPDKQFTAKLFLNDSLILAPNIEQDTTTAYLYSSDIIEFDVTGVSLMTNVHTQMNTDQRKIYGKIEITYTDPFSDESIVVTASDTAYNTTAGSTADNVSGTQYKFFALNSNQLNNTYHPIDFVDGNSMAGWRSIVVADSSGVFATPPVLTVEFDLRSIFTLKVIGDTSLNEYPVDFTIDLKNASDTVLYTETVTGNTAVSWEKDITPVISVTKMQLTITKWCVASNAKISEFYSAVVEVYEGDDLEYIHLLEEQVFENNTLPIGNVSSNEIDITINNESGKFDVGNKYSSLFGMLRKNRRVRAWLGTDITDGIIEWYPLGTFWTMDWNAPRSGIFASTTARDRMELLRTTDFTKSQVYVNQTIYWLCETVLVDAGLKPEEYVIDTNLNSYTIPYSWFNRMSHRDALVRIASTGLIRVYCNRLGQVVIEAYAPQPYPICEFTEDDNVFDINHPLVWSQIVNYVEVKVSTMVPSAQKAVYTLPSSQAIPIPANSTSVETINFDYLPVMNAQPPVMTASTGITIDSIEYYAWVAEITFINSSGSDGTVNSLTIQGQVLEASGSRIIIAQDAKSIRDNFKQKYSILDNELIQDANLAQTIANNILSVYKDPRHDVTLETRGNIALTLGDRVTAPGYDETDKEDYFVVRQDITWDGALVATIRGQKIGGV